MKKKKPKLKINYTFEPNPERKDLAYRFLARSFKNETNKNKIKVGNK